MVTTVDRSNIPNAHVSNILNVQNQTHQLIHQEQIIDRRVAKITSLCLKPVKSAASWGWDTIALRPIKEKLALPLLALAAVGLFPLWASVAMVISSMALIYSSIFNIEKKTAQYKEEINQMSTSRRGLEDRNHELLNQCGDLEATNRLLSREKQHLTQERDQSDIQRRQAINSQSSLHDAIADAQERNAELSHQLRELTLSVAQLTRQRDDAISAQRQSDIERTEALETLADYQIQESREQPNQRLAERLGEFKNLYEQSNQGDQTEMTQMALNTLIPEYQQHREELHRMIESLIADLPPSDLTRVPLRGILRLSKDETVQIERISQALHLHNALSRNPFLSSR